MDADRFTGLGFLASYWNADPSVIGPLEVVSSLAVQVVWGMQPAQDTDPPQKLYAWRDRCHAYGLGVIPWGWCDARDVAGAKAEGRYHAERLDALALDEEVVYIPNMEAPYDAYGNSSAPQFPMAEAYGEALTERLDSLGLGISALAVTTTPFFASSQWQLAAAGWVTMPQAFSADYSEATVARAVEHMTGWGWPRAQIRPLVQTYAKSDVYPPAEPYLVESEAAQVGVVPYTVEQAVGENAGRELIRALTPATMRPPCVTETEDNDVQVIGAQDGIVAEYNRLRDLDPGGTLLVRDAKGKWPSISTLDGIPLEQWKAYDKAERRARILKDDHDAEASAVQAA